MRHWQQSHLRTLKNLTNEIQLFDPFTCVLHPVVSGDHITCPVLSTGQWMEIKGSGWHKGRERPLGKYFAILFSSTTLLSAGNVLWDNINLRYTILLAG